MSAGGSQHRPVGSLDVAASGLARLLPRFAARLDQLRLDAHAVGQGLRGRSAPPLHAPAGDPARPAPLASIDPIAELLPRGLAVRYAATRRDLRVLLGGLRGDNPPPLIDRPMGVALAPVVPARATAAQTARALRVVAVERQTAEAVAITLEDSAGRDLAFVPGQFFTVLVDIDGEVHRRAYSVASHCLDRRQVTIAVKRVADGRVSNYLNDHMAPGRELRALGPSGSFTCAPDPHGRRHIVLLAGGSGVTPMMAIARAVLASEPGSRVSLVYGNRGEADVMFRAELDALAAEHGDALTLRYVLSAPPEGWTGGVGLLDEPTVAAELDALAADARPTTYYVCGPAPMMAAARAALRARGTADRDVHEESFSQPHLRPAPPTARIGAAQPVVFVSGGVRREVKVAAGDTILDAGLAAGVPLKFSCAMGGCGACKLKLADGALAMEEPNCLTAGEREAGFVLACVARPTGPCTVEPAE